MAPPGHLGPRNALWLVSTAAALAICLLAPKQAYAAPSSDQCSPAVAVLEDVLSRRGHSSRPLVLGRSVTMAATMAKNASTSLAEPGYSPPRWAALPPDSAVPYVAPPSPALMKRFAEHSPQSATECQAVRALAVRRGIGLGGRAGPIRSWRRPYRDATINLTSAVTSDDGLDALVYMDSVSGPLTGSGQLLLLRRKPGERWRLVGGLGLWVS